jgi:CheY-like chemotaxis protein
MNVVAPAGTVEGLRVFVVEDEALVLMNLESMLEDLGCVVAEQAMRPSQLAALIERGVQADVAILDVNLGGTLVFEYARTLAQRGMPLVFATGYGRNGLPQEWQGHPIVQKPYTSGEVAAALAAAMEG